MRTTTTTAKAGNGTKDTGAGRTMTTAIGATTIMGEAIVIMMTMTATDR
jgi:hypothetical protein